MERAVHGRTEYFEGHTSYSIPCARLRLGSSQVEIGSAAKHA